MNTQRVKLAQAFRSGVNFKFKKVDYSTAAITRETRELQVEKERVKKSTEVDINELKKLTFTV